MLIHDPLLGVRSISLKRASRHFTGVALELTPTTAYRPKPVGPRVKLSDVFGRIIGLRRSLLQVLLIALAIESLLIAQPFFLQWVVDHALLSADRDLLITLSLGFAFLMIIQVVFTALRSVVLMVISASLKIQSRASLFTHLQRLPSSYFETRHLGDIVSRFSSLTTIQEALTSDFIEAVLDGILALLTLGIMALFSPLLTIVVLVGTVAYGLIRWLLYAPLRDASMEAIVWAARRDNHFLETLRAIKTIKLLVAQETRRAHWLNLLVETTNRDLTAQKLRIVFRTVNGLLQGALTIVVIWLASQLVLDGVFSVGMLLAFVAYKSQFMTRISELIDKAVDLRMLRLHTERLSDIALAEPESGPGGIGLARIEPMIEVRELRFRYSEHDAWILDGLNFRIEAGESVAITGRSGCGKSTLLKILSSLLVPTSGEVLIGGQPIKRIGLDNCRRLISVVMQDDQLIAGSIADNISFFSPDADRLRIEVCAKLAAIHEDVLAMPMGYESLIGDMGTSLSGGQKQRILLARALYRKPKILLLDEATSHLDGTLERAVNAAIRETRMTRVIVAHRTETIDSAQRVIVLDAGRIVSNVARSSKSAMQP